VTHPFPGAFAFLDDRKLYVWEARPDPGASTAPAAPGHLHPGPELRVATGEGDLVLLRLQFAGGPELDASELASRHSLPAGTIFG
jgi:methionyl-tRNA formyltransferase